MFLDSKKTETPETYKKAFVLSSIISLVSLSLIYFVGHFYFGGFWMVTQGFNISLSFKNIFLLVAMFNFFIAYGNSAG